MRGARRAAGLWLVVVTFGLVAAAAAADPVPLAEEGSGGWFVEPLDAGDQSGSGASDPDPEPANESRRLQGAVSAVLELVALVVIAAVVTVLARAVVRRFQGTEQRPDLPARPVRAGPPTPELAAAVEEGRHALESGPVDDAIIACWLRLEEAAARAGIARLPSETATELTVRLLDRFDVPRPAVDRLLSLYRRARYSHHRLGPPDRADALAALDAIGVAIDRVAV